VGKIHLLLLILCKIWCKRAGDQLYDSASRLRIPNLPAFALECLPNRNSLLYGDLYGIENEASTIFRGTLRYEGMISFLALNYVNLR
jgi:hypothetical protein